MHDAVPRWYRGERFRSTLEADWAANLDELGIKWDYEPSAFKLPSGRFYVPDFRCPGIGTWLEVKGDGVPGLEKTHEFSVGITGSDADSWPGGVLVLIGHSIDFTLSWSPLNTWLVKCPECEGHSWVTARAPACRICRADLRRPMHFYSPGELPAVHVDRCRETIARLCHGSK
jgi:hypothetical protein